MFVPEVEVVVYYDFYYLSLMLLLLLEMLVLNFLHHADWDRRLNDDDYDEFSVFFFIKKYKMKIQNKIGEGK